MHVLGTFDVLKKNIFSSFFFFCSNKLMPQASDLGCIWDTIITDTEVFVQMSLCHLIHRISSGRQSLGFEYVAIF